MNKTKHATVICAIAITFMFTIMLVSMIVFKIRVNESTRISDNTYHNTYRSYYVMIVDNPESPFWKSVYENLYNLCDEQNIYAEMFGSQFTKSYTRLELLQMAIDCKVDGIFLEADESSEMTGLINDAVDRGIPVITMISDNAVSKRQSFIGISSYNLGIEYGNRIISLAKEETVNVLLLMNSQMKNFGQALIYSGLQESIDETDLKHKVQVSSTVIDDSDSFATEESIRDIFMNQKELPDIIICLDEINTTCVYQAVVDHNKVGTVNIIGYYTSDTILRGIKKNVIDSTVSLDTDQIASHMLDCILEYELFGKVSVYYSVNTTMITQKNVDTYLEVEQ